ncbi:MAG: hypothetical protein U0744_13995 [Gemmataceae bacterium]
MKPQTGHEAASPEEDSGMSIRARKPLRHADLADPPIDAAEVA